MGKLNIFEISFTNTSGIFYAGNLLEGQVTVEVAEPIKTRGIKLHFGGGASVWWTETETRTSGKKTTRRTVTYSAYEKYFDQIVVLFGTIKGDTTEISPGRHVFPFQFQIPMGLPSSYESHIGHVRYTVKCSIDRPWKFDHTTKRAFTILSILDLNQYPHCLQRLHTSKEKTLCCLCCASGPIHATFSIDRQGYVPGEAIKLYAEISNASSRKMDKSYVELIMLTRYHATTKTKIVRKSVACVYRPAIAAHSEDVWNGEELVIPPIPPSYLNGCRIIDIQYILQLNVDPSGPSLDLEIPFEVIIGTIPLIQVVQENPPSPPPNYTGYPGFAGATAASDGTYPTAPLYTYPTAPPGNVPELPPPSYYECITGQVSIRDEEDNEHTRGQLDYAPYYTYYNWGNTPNPLPLQKPMTQ